MPAPDAAVPPLRLDESPFFWLARASAGYQGVMGRALKRVGIDAPAWRVLMILAEYAPASVATLAECAGIAPSTMVRVVQRMRADDLVATAPAATDGRVTEVTLTEHGRAELARVHEVAGRVARRAFAGQDAAGQTELIASLRRLVAALDDPA